MRIDRIFTTGAPGSQWSSPDRALRKTYIDIDNSDVTEVRNLGGKKPYPGMPMNKGAYINWGGETGDWVLGLPTYSKEEWIRGIDQFYSPIPTPRQMIIRIHKSHHFAYNLERIMTMFPESTIIASVNEPYKCAIWWEHCGGHETIIGGYQAYERDYERIWNEINSIHYTIHKWADKYKLKPEIWRTELLDATFPDYATLPDRTQNKEHDPGVVGLITPADKGFNLSNTQRVFVWQNR
jgi:hypothetical protein